MLLNAGKSLFSSPAVQPLSLFQDVLRSRPDGDCQVNNLRRRGQTLFDRQDVAEDQKCQVQQAVKDAEEQWSKVLRVAAQLQEEAATQIDREMESRDSEVMTSRRRGLAGRDGATCGCVRSGPRHLAAFCAFQLREFQSLRQETGRWLSDLQRQLDSLGGLATAQERLHAAQVIRSSAASGLDIIFAKPRR